MIEKMFYHRRDSSLNCKPIKKAIRNIKEDAEVDQQKLCSLFSSMI